MSRFISNSYGVFFAMAVFFALAQNSFFAVYLAIIALAAGLHYLQAHSAEFPRLFKPERNINVAPIADKLHIIGNVLLAVLIIRELLLII